MDEQRKQIPQLDGATGLSAADLFIVSQNEGVDLDYTRTVNYGFLKQSILAGVQGSTGSAGNDGSTGATGAQGATGPRGFTGPSGATGPSGIADRYQTTSVSLLTLGLGTKNLIVETELNYTPNQNVTISQSSDPTNHMHGYVVNYNSLSGALEVNVYRFSGSGTSAASWVVNLSGAVGAIGPTGAKGSTGEQGSTGATGAAGATGAQGSTGPSGLQGNTGASGEIGATGLQGATGLFGATGATGTQGLTGPSGATGSQGATGPSGLAGEQGNTGATGEQGATGERGSSGVDGSTGPQGSTGATGLTGATGDRYSTTSNTPLTVGDGDANSHQTLTVEQGLGYTPNQNIIITMVSNVAYHMDGYVYSYDKSSGALVARITAHTGNGQTSSLWTVNLAGAVGAVGATGLTGLTGATGTVGLTGATGPAGSGGDGNLVFASSGANRTLTGFVENGVTSTVRTTAITEGKLILTLAAFTPAIAASSNGTLNWDVAASSFSVSVDNPADVVNQYISGVLSVSQLTGSVSTTLSDYTQGNETAVPAGGVDWNQTFTTNNSTSYIRSTSTNATGGSASGRVAFNYYDGSSISTWSSTADFSVNWNNVTHNIVLSSLSGKTFLQTYTSSGYTVSTSGLTNTALRAFTVSGTNGTPSNTSGSGTLNFTTAINKTNASSTNTSVTLSTVCTRPVNVTGTSYQVTLGPTSTINIATGASFTYPSFWMWTAGLGVKPSQSTVINDSGTGGFENSTTPLADVGVTTLGSQVNTFSASVNNTDVNPRAFWFAVRASVSQPTTFKTGESIALLSAVSVLDGGTIALQPDNPPAGYVAENYRIWGITLQPGTTYVSIS
jgi:hypothetical protein